MSKKGKGSGWERDIAKFLTNWLTGQKKEYYFWRSPGSGSIATTSCINHDLCGDIIPLKPESDIICSNFVIECKTGYKETSLDKHLKENKTDNLRDFWTQVTGDCEKNNKNQMLIYKKLGFKTPWIGVNEFCKNKFDKYLKGQRFVHLYWGDLPDTYLYEMYEFFEKITPEIMREVFKCID